MSQMIFVDWDQFLKDIYAQHLLDNPIRLGGLGRVDEIDEGVFTRRKYNHGRSAREQRVFGGIYTTTQQAFLVALEQRCGR